MDSPCIKQTVCKVLKIFQYGKYLVAYVLNMQQFGNTSEVFQNNFKYALLFLILEASTFGKGLLLLLFYDTMDDFRCMPTYGSCL